MQSLVGKCSFALRRRHAKDAQAERWCDEITERIEVGALGSPPASEREVTRGLACAVAVGSLMPQPDRGPVLVCIEQHVRGGRVELEGAHSVGREVLDLVHLNCECAEQKIDSWVAAASLAGKQREEA